MGERKVLNKYFPPDFDPAAIPRCSIKRDRQYKVRLMAPFNMRCKSCGNYIYKGTKFNAIKETAKGEEYLGMLIFRFYIRCTACSAEITFKTDPKNTDYVCEIGATRNFEEWRMKDRIGTIDDEIAAEEEEKEEVNPMKALEERTKESKAEMDMIDALEDLKDANARSSKVSVDSVIASKVEQGQAHIRALAAKINADEDAAVAKHFSKQEGPVIKRLDDEVKPEPTSDASMQSAFGAPKAKKIKSLATSDRSTGSFGGMKKLGSLVKRKQLVKPAETAKEKVLPAKPAGLGLVGDYSSDSD